MAADVVPVVAAVAEVKRRRCNGRVDGGAADVPALAAASVVARPSCNAPVAPADVGSKDEAGVEAAAVVGATGDVAAEGGGGAADGEIYVVVGAAASQTAAVAETCPRRQTATGVAAAGTPPAPLTRSKCARNPAVAARRPSARRRGARIDNGEARNRRSDVRWCRRWHRKSPGLARRAVPLARHALRRSCAQQYRGVGLASRRGWGAEAK